ncbi:DUF2637 domain-containing protein [Paeniglutamicibacter cryotolerans]|uniref:DUF2637 domain-containing protein n=1 Tax=Paeniglutamicibacter cryotolerans TaxID=670079 RepID=A0A839QN37_9MICC|nr:DUF2637 domain-containing protein [Paeniglutamicibacter cryotolerans]MBB2997317.1 hypothetical protein [Paeniglutamicibacter cryotolerans]
MLEKLPNEPHKTVLGTAVAATVLIAIGAFVLSFAALTDLAQRSGIEANLAWIWPIIVDGMIVAATVAIVALNGHSRRAMIYPWALLFFGAIVSTAANSVHAILSVDKMASDIPPLVSALVAAMPPVVLLAITHLTVHMYQKRAEAAELRAIRDHDEEAVAGEKYGVAYDDGWAAAMDDAQAAADAARVEHTEELSRLRAEQAVAAKHAATKQQVAAVVSAAPVKAKATGTLPAAKVSTAGGTNETAPLYDEAMQALDGEKVTGRA